MGRGNRGLSVGPLGQVIPALPPASLENMLASGSAPALRSPGHRLLPAATSRAQGYPERDPEAMGDLQGGISASQRKETIAGCRDG